MVDLARKLQEAVRLHQAGQFDQARQHYEGILKSEPNHADALHLLGLISHQTGDHTRGVELIQKALKQRPSEPVFLDNLAIIYTALQCDQDAAACYQQLVRLGKSDPEVWHRLGECWRRLGRWAEAAEAFNQVLVLHPGHLGGLNGMGVVRQKQRQPEIAEIYYRQYLERDPTNVSVLCNLGAVLMTLGRFPEAEQYYLQAARLDPQHLATISNLGVLRRLQGRLDEALGFLEQVLADDPQHADAHFNRSMISLAHGDFENGLPEYEWRWQARPGSWPTQALHRWAGQPLADRTILIFSEQGLGDTIQFIRYARELKQQGARVIAAIQPTLIPLLRQLHDVDEWVAYADSWPPHDYCTSLLSLPLHLNATRGSLTFQTPYLQPLQEKRVQWQSNLEKIAGFKVGLVWQGSQENQADRWRSLPLSALAPLGELPGVCLFSLQKGVGSEQLADWPGSQPIHRFGDELDQDAPFLDTAAILGCLDLVICIDTAVAHLAGAMGVPVWLLLSYAPDWRWSLGQSESAWYPSMRLFRQPSLDNWTGVIEQVRTALSEAIGCVEAPERKSSVQALFREAVQFQQSNRFSEAERLYHQVLEKQPNHPDALHLLGLCLHQSSRSNEAEGWILQALQVRPEEPLFLGNLGNVYLSLNRPENAIEVYRRAAELQPEQAGRWLELGKAALIAQQLDLAVSALRQAVDLEPKQSLGWVFLGRALSRQQAYSQALACFDQALEYDSNATAAWFSRGNTLRELGQFDAAAEAYQEVLVRQADHVESLNNLGVVRQHQGMHAEAAEWYKRTLKQRPEHIEALYNLGTLFQNNGQLAEATHCLEQVVQKRPQHVEALINLGGVCFQSGDYPRAASYLEAAVELDPNRLNAWNSLGAVRMHQDRFVESEDCFRQVLTRNPDDVSTLSNLGGLLQLLGKPEAALEVLERAIAVQPDYALARLNRAIIWLLLGDFAQGWQEYEWRWRTGDYRWPRTGQPIWDGSDANGKTLVLFAEQGLGDSIQFIRFSRLLRACGAKVILAVPAKLLPLLANYPHQDGLVALDQPWPAFDACMGMLGVPRLLGTDLRSIPADSGYLTSQPARVAYWRGILDAFVGFKIGLAWQGSSSNKRDRWRSIPLSAFAPLAEIPGVSLISLQKGPGSDQRASWAGKAPIHTLPPKVDQEGAFLDTAAIMQSLDLVITSDTAVAHLAGAVGVPVWVALAISPDWRWLLGRWDSPWYPTMRLFRQSELGNWHSVFTTIAEELSAKLGTTPPSSTPPKPSTALLPAMQTPLRAEPASFEAVQDGMGTPIPSPVIEVADLLRQAMAHHTGQRLSEAEALYRRLLSMDPEHPDALHLLGLVCHQTGRSSEGIQWIRKALMVRPDEPVFLGNLGTILLGVGPAYEAVKVWQRLIELGHDSAENQVRLGRSFAQAGQHAQALDSLEQALKLTPSSVSGQFHRANALRNLGRLDEAIEGYERVLSLRPEHLDARTNLGVSFHLAGRFSEAARTYSEVLEHEPDYANARFNRGMLRLLHGDWAGGFSDYAIRWQASGRAKPLPVEREWDGSDPAGKTILLQSEQGLGDTIQFIRYAQLLHERDVRVVARVQSALIPLLKSCPGIHELCSAEGPLPAYDRWVSLLSLPERWQTCPDTVPCIVPYLYAEEQRVARWQARLESRKGFRVGIAWQGSKSFARDLHRSIPLRYFQSLALEGVNLICLQKDPSPDQLAEWKAASPLHDLGPELDAEDAFLDTAAVMQGLDLVITSDTAIAHLAGAMGRTVWLATPYSPDWRWLLDRSDSPWYPTMRLFRQPRFGDWPAVFATIRIALRAHLESLREEPQ